MARKKYLIVNPSFYPSTGGVETTIRGMVEALVRAGEEVVIVTGNKTNYDSTLQPREEVLFGAKVYRYKFLPFFLYYFSCILLLLKVKKNNFDVVISRNFVTTICLIVANYRNIKYIAPGVYRYQNSLRFRKKKNLKEFFSYIVNSLLETICFISLSKVYVFSSELEGQIRKISKKIEIIKVIPGIDSSRFYSVDKNKKIKLRVKEGLPKCKKIILFMGRIEKVKNPSDVISILKYLPKDYITVIVGEGAIKNDLENKVKSLDLTDRVFFKGFTTKPEVYYQLADIFLMTSVYEPFGQVILEALASGLQVYGYQSSSHIKTATSELLLSLNLNPDDFLVPFNEGVEGLSRLILRNSSGIGTKKLLLNDWESFVKSLS